MSERRAARIIALAAAALLVALAWLRPPLGTAWGDEGTYLAMAESVAAEGDLRFDESDLERARREACPGLILQRPADGRLAYSKPALYPLAGGLLARALGGAERAGAALLAINFAALGITVLVLGRRFHRLGPAGRAELALVAVVAGGALLPYALWRMTEALEVGLVAAGLALALPEARRSSSPGDAGTARAAPGEPARALLGASLLGLATSLRYPNLALGLVPVLAALLLRRPRRAAALGAATVAALLCVLLVTRAFAGSADPYRSLRAGFDCETGYPAGADAARPLARFVSERATNDVVTRPAPSARTVAYAALYFLVGRHTGMLVYFPALIALVPALVRRARDPVVAAVLAGAAALLAFYLLFMPENYFGGGTVVGNRYALPVLVAFAVALPVLPSRRALLVGLGVAVVVGLSALASVARTGGVDRGSQSHASAGLFRWLPYESTAPDLDGRRDRYWSGELVRFIDPYAEAAATSFTLSAGEPGADLLVANRRGRGTMRFLVASPPTPPAEPSGTPATDVLELRVQELGWTRTFTIGRSPGGGVRSVVEYAPLPAWRRHPFWWAPRSVIYDARLVRLSIRAPGAATAAATQAATQATLRYLGDGAALKASLAREVIETDVPASASAGAAATLRLRVRNTGDTTWSPSAVLPVQVGVGIAREGGPDRAGAGAETDMRRVPLPGDVAPGAEVAIEVPVVWPKAPGSYRVRIDLVLEEVAWFADRNGGVPVLEAVVEVGPRGD